jgi:hypothetical protein
MLQHATLGGSTTMSLKEKISRSAEAFLTVQAQNLPLQFYTSTLNGLVDLVEDEIIPTPIPMEVQYFIYKKCAIILHRHDNYVLLYKQP